MDAAPSDGSKEAAQQFLAAVAAAGVPSDGLDAGAAALATAAAASGSTHERSMKGGGRWVVDVLSVVCSGCHQTGIPDPNTLAAKLRPLVHAWVTTAGSNPGASS